MELWVAEDEVVRAEQQVQEVQIGRDGILAQRLFADSISVDDALQQAYAPRLPPPFRLSASGLPPPPPRPRPVFFLLV